MRDVDLKRLEQPYPKDAVGRSVADLARALGFSIPNLRELMGMVREDLDTKAYGIGWWKPATETADQLRARIVVSDYLVIGVESIELNLIDLGLHLMELHDWWDREGAFLKNCGSVGAQGHLIPKMPPRLRALDELAPAMVDVHVNGFFRSVASTLDCLASAVIGVGAIEADILRADWSKLIEKQLPKVTDDGTAGRKLQLVLRRDLSALAAKGEQDWDLWASDYRNMLVHRARRQKLSALEPVLLFDSREQPMVLTSCVHVLCRDPDLSEMEAMSLSDNTPPVLTEDAKTTLAGLTNDLSGFIEGVTGRLVELWKVRRNQPALLPQPTMKQWKDVRRKSKRGFRGYKPNEIPYKPGAFSANHVYVKRLQAASLMNGDEKKTWK